MCISDILMAIEATNQLQSSYESVQSPYYQLFKGICWRSQTIPVCSAGIVEVFLSRIVPLATSIYFASVFCTSLPLLLISTGRLMN